MAAGVTKRLCEIGDIVEVLEAGKLLISERKLMFDFHTVVWLEHDGGVSHSSQQDKDAALREACALLRQGKNVLAISHGNTIIMESTAIRAHCLPQSK
jgi:hypothetical protein